CVGAPRGRCADRRSDRWDAACHGGVGVGVRRGGAGSAGRRCADDGRRIGGLRGRDQVGGLVLAVRGAGVESSWPVLLSLCIDLSRMFWGFGFRGRPARRVTEVLADLIDSSSVGGGTFELGSQAFAMTRVVTGQFDAVIEVGSRLIDEVPGLQAEFERVGRGQILNNSPYDLAAAWLCLVEAGGVCTDGWGRPLNERRLLGSGHEYQISTISASNQALHATLLQAVDDGVRRLRRQRASGS